MDPLNPAQNDWTTADVFLHHHRDPEPPHDAAAGAGIDADDLAERFPDALRDQALTEAVTALAAAGACCAAALRVAAAPPQTADAPDGGAADPLLAAAGAIDAGCRSFGGAWGLWPDGVLGCCLPGAAPADAERLLTSLRDDLRRRYPGAVLTAGVAGHPLLGYAPSDLIGNAFKAADHAAFFDEGAVIVIDAVSLNISGDRLFEAGDITAAMAEYENALALDAGNVNVLNSLGACYGQLGAYEKSLRYFDAAESADPAEYMAVYNIGLAHLLMGDRRRARERFARAAAMAPDVFAPAFQLGRTLIADGDAAGALEPLQRAAGIHPGSGGVQKLLGQCHETLGHLDAAIAAYKKAVTQNPNDPESLSALGCLFDRQGENPEITIIFCQQSVDLAPDNGLYRLRLGRLYRKQGMLQEALEAFKAADRCGAADAAAQIAGLLDQMDADASADIPN